MNAIDDISAERRRQVEEEGWTPQHDDRHADGCLVNAAIAYALNAEREIAGQPGFFSPPPRCWPWEASWWKPKGARKDLVRAAALIVAEIERLDRGFEL